MWKTWWSSKSLPSSCGLKSIQFSSGSRSPREDVTSPPFSRCGKVWIFDVCVWVRGCRKCCSGSSTLVGVQITVLRGHPGQRWCTSVYFPLLCMCCVYRRRAAAESWSSASLAARGAACGSAWPRSPDRGTPPTTWSAPRCPPRSAGRTGGWRGDAPPPTALTKSGKMKKKKDSRLKAAISRRCSNNTAGKKTKKRKQKQALIKTCLQTGKPAELIKEDFYERH